MGAAGWTAVKQERQAETAAAARVTAIDDRLDRSFLRGGPRGHERTQLRAEADRLRAAYPAAGTDDRAPVWEQRAESAWAQDTAAVQQLRTRAATLRDSADRVQATLLPRLAERREQAQDRMSELAAEQRQRQGEPPRPRQEPAAQHNRFGPWASLNSEPDGVSRANRGVADEPAPSLNQQPGHSPQL